MKIGIIGAAGRMGRVLVQEVLRHPACILSGGCDRKESPFIGKDLGILTSGEPCGMTLHADLEQLIKASDAVIDFTSPEATLATAALTAKHQVAHIIGTTGLSDTQFKQLKKFAEQTAIVWSSNMSIGVTLLHAITEQVAKLLGTDYDIEILEMHHRHKKDAPSGTAITLGQAAAKGRGVEFSNVARYSREGIVGERPEGEIGFATLRGGSVIGDHTVIFASDEDRIELTHKSSSRFIYAKGAIRACLWTKGKQPGLYSIKDVLSL